MTSICNGIAYSVNMRVRITSFARTDAIGRIIEIRQSFTQWATDPVAIVRLPNWLADGHHLDVAVSLPELTPVPDESVVYYRAERNPMNDGRMEYRFPAVGVAFTSLAEARTYFRKLGFGIQRTRATRRNKLYA